MYACPFEYRKKKKKESFLYIFCMKSDLKINLSGVTFAKQNSLFYFLYKKI